MYGAVFRVSSITTSGSHPHFITHVLATLPFLPLLFPCSTVFLVVNPYLFSDSIACIDIGTEKVQVSPLEGNAHS